jgi:hypothetical protein
MNAGFRQDRWNQPRSVFHMRRFAITLSVLAAMVFATGLAAQAPNFSGKWAPDTDKNPAPMTGATGNPTGTNPAGMRGMAGPMTITMDAKTMKVEKSSPGYGTSTCTYSLDGSESKCAMGRGGDRTSTAKWDGSKLVITTKAMQTGSADAVTSYSMDGAELVVETNSPVAKTYYKKSS